MSSNDYGGDYDDALEVFQRTQEGGLARGTVLTANLIRGLLVRISRSRSELARRALTSVSLYHVRMVASQRSRWRLTPSPYLRCSN